jgi:hypothetical protein
MGLLMLASLLGLLGHGPVSSSTLDDPASGMLVKYERFERSNAETLFTIQVKPESATTQARLSIGTEFLGKVEISRIEPEPVEVELWPDRITYVFTVPEPGAAGEIVIHYKPVSFGRVQVEMGLAGYPVQTFSQFIYP